MGFSAEWLSLREPADHRARNAVVLDAAVSLLAGKDAPLLVDLASGTGSTVRAMQHVLPKTQKWRLCELDDALIGAGQEQLSGFAATYDKRDLMLDLPAALLGKPDLVTTSAFLDLVSADWLDLLIATLKAQGLPFYAAITYDGRATCDPPHKLDRAVIEAVNRHQRTDKGFGPALGPDAASEAITRFEAAGFKVTSGASDWLFQKDEGLVQSMMIHGWAEAAHEIGGLDEDDLIDWRDWHLTRIADGDCEIMVGHIDFLAVLR
jgi:hypothetical protein